MNDLTISGNNFSIDCNCSRWDSDSYQVIMEAWLKKSDLKNLRDNITPGAVDELYTVLGKPFYYDKTWTAENTIRLIPDSDNFSNLYNMKTDKIIYVKNITSTPIRGDSLWLNCKIEGYLSGNQIL